MTSDHGKKNTGRPLKPNAGDRATASPHDLGSMTWCDAQEWIGDDVWALLPIGSTEAHGPHLPLNTDVIISEGMARRAAEALEAEGIRALILPSLSFGVTDYARSFAGTLGIRPQTLRALLVDLVQALRGRGVSRLCLVNSHLEPEHVRVLRGLVGVHEGVTIVFPDKTRRRWVETLPDEFQRGACHAGAYETSLVLAERPELVRMTRAQSLEPLDIDLAKAMREGVTRFEDAGATQAYFGDPAHAHPDEGERVYQQLVNMIVVTIKESLSAKSSA